jgi:hypothetical protein
MGLFRKAAVSAAVAVAKDHSNDAINFFTSIRIPAALIAGSSLAALFSLASKTKDTQANSRTQLESIVLIAYHILALASLLLSMNVVVTATAAASTIMFGTENAMATSAFELMKREYEFEFQMTRWSFFAGMFAFLGCVAARALIEFELLHKTRLRSALLVLSSVGALFFHLLAYVSATLICYGGMAEMTWAVFVMWFQRSITGHSPCELASICCFIVSVATAVSLFRRSGMFSKNGESGSIDVVQKPKSANH